MEKAMGMSDDVWARHASDWSVLTRIATAPLIFAAVWSHTVVGAWWIAFLVIITLWLWLNPRLFPKPTTTNKWGSKATFGERVFLNRKTVPIPAHHRSVPHVLAAIAGAGFILGIAGAWLNDITPTFVGIAFMYLGKLWFLDRMVWLYDEMKDATPEYRRWLY